METTDGFSSETFTCLLRSATLLKSVRHHGCLSVTSEKNFRPFGRLLFVNKTLFKVGNKETTKAQKKMYKFDRMF